MMNSLSLIYARIVTIESRVNHVFSKDSEKFISNELERIYLNYQGNSKLKMFIPRYMNNILIKNGLNLNYQNLRSEKENRELFYELYSNLYNFLYINDKCLADWYLCENKWNVGDLVLGYILLRELNMSDDILNNFDYTLVGNLSKFLIYNDSVKERIFNQETAFNMIYKIKSIKRGRKEVKYAIPFEKTNPCDMIKIAMYNEDIMSKTHHLYTDISYFMGLASEQQEKIKQFIDGRKKDHIEIFQQSRDGIFPLIAKDVVGLINEMMYPELDLQKIINGIVNKCENRFRKFENCVENDTSKTQNEEYIKFKTPIILLLNFLLNSLDEVKSYERLTLSIEFRQEKLQISAIIYKLLKLNLVKYFTKLHKRFYDTVENKRIDLFKAVQEWKKQGDDVDWFLEILNSN